MPNTPVFGWPYQGSGNQPHGPNLGELLALAAEATVAGVKSTADAAAAADVTLTAFMNRVLSAAKASVATSQTTASTSYTDLATVGPAVTVTTSTRALVFIMADLGNATGWARMSVAVSGATTIAASDGERALSHSASVLHRSGITILELALNAGSNTFTAKYKATAGTSTFADRTIIVVPL